MPRVVPSQVVAFMDKAYGAEPHGGFGSLDFKNGPTIEAITNLVDQIPIELIALDANDYSAFTASLATMKYWVARWKASGNVGTIDRVRGYQQQHALSLLRAALAKCPDEAPAAATVGLEFIEDEPHRKSTTNRY